MSSWCQLYGGKILQPTALSLPSSSCSLFSSTYIFPTWHIYIHIYIYMATYSHTPSAPSPCMYVTQDSLSGAKDFMVNSGELV